MPGPIGRAFPYLEVPMADYFTDFTDFPRFLDARKSIKSISAQDRPAAALNVEGADA